MGNMNLLSLIQWSRSRHTKRKGTAISADKATSSVTGPEDQELNETRCRKAKNGIRSLISRTVQSTRTFFRIGRRAPVSEIPVDASMNNTAIFTICNGATDNSAGALRRPNNSSSENTTETEFNTERTFANFETTLEQSPARQTLDSTKLRETTTNSRTSIFSVGKSKIWNRVKNESSPSASLSTVNFIQFASSSTKRKSKRNFSQSSIKTPARSYPHDHSSTLTPASGASSASPWTGTGSDFFSPISSDQSLSAHTSINFKFNDGYSFSKDLINSESPVHLSTQAYNRTPENATENEDRKTSDARQNVGGNCMVYSSLSHRRSILAEHLDNIASRRIGRSSQISRPNTFCSKDGHPLTFEDFCKSLRQTAEVTTLNSLVSINEDRPPALPPKLHKFRFSCTPTQFSKTDIDDTYVEPQRPTSFPTFSRTVKPRNETNFTPDNDYYEIPEFVDVGSPSRRPPRQPDTSNTGHPIVDVPRALEDSHPPPPLPPRCPRVTLLTGVPQRSENTGRTSLMDCPPPLPPRIPTIRLSETVDVATRLTLRGITAIALASSLDDFSRRTPSHSTTVATQTLHVGRTVATQTIPDTLFAQFSTNPTTDGCPSVPEVTVIHPDDLNVSKIYLSMNGC